MFVPSENIRPVSMNLEEAVFEFRHDGLEDDPKKSEQEERALAALPEAGAYSVRILEADYFELRDEEKEVSPLIRWRRSEASPDPPDSTEDLIRVRPLGVCRDRHLVRLEATYRRPFATKSLRGNRTYRRILFSISVFPEGTVEVDAERNDPGFDAILSKILVNPEAPLEWRRRRRPNDEVLHPDIPSEAEGPFWKVLLGGEGFFFLPESILPEGFELKTCGLYDGGEPAPRLRLPESTFGEEGFLLYSRDESVWSATNAVWLFPDFDGESRTIPLSVASEPAGPISEGTFASIYEEDEVFISKADKSSRQARNWMWSAVGPKGFSWIIPLEDLSPEEDAIRVAVDLAFPWIKGGGALGVHDFRFCFGGREVSAGSYTSRKDPDNNDRFRVEFTTKIDERLRRSIERDAGVEIAVDLSTGIDEAENGRGYLDRIEVAYRRRLRLRQGEIRIPLSVGDGPWRVEIGEDPPRSKEYFAFLMGSDDPVARLETTAEFDGTLLVSAPGEAFLDQASEVRVFPVEKVRMIESVVPRASDRLLSRDMGADSLLIVHPPFISETAPLVAFHESLGLRVEVVETDEVYDTFGDGTGSPEHIKAFLRYAYNNWTFPPPRSVTLIGDATWDHKGRFGNGILNQVPAYRTSAGKGREGSYANDHWYVCLDGDDLLPEMLVGRIAVNTRGRLRTVVRKIVEGYAPKGPWRAKMILMSDKEREFRQELESLLREDWVPDAYHRSWMRVDEYAFADNYYLQEPMMRAGKKKHSPEFNQALRDKIDEGAVFWDFHGHGAPNVLGHERLLFGGGSIHTDVKKLRNGRKYPFVIGNTCDTARFDYAEDKWNVCLGEDLLQHPDGGVVAMLLHTGRGFPDDHRVIDRMYQQSMFRFGFRRVGEVAAAGKMLHLLSDKDSEPITMMVLLGDPWTPIPLPEGELSVSVTPDRFVEGAEGPFSLRIEAAPEDAALRTWLDSGRYRAYAYLFDGDFREVWAEDGPLLGGYSREIDLPADLAVGEGTVGVYFYPEERRDGLDLPDLIGSATFEVASNEDQRRLARERIVPGGLPNVRILDLRTTPESPINGHTIWIHVDIVNDGAGVARRVEVEGYRDERDKAKQIASFEEPGGFRQKVWRTEDLYPGEETTITLRWDPFDNAGRSRVIVVADPNQRIGESNEEDNSATTEIVVRRKGDLVIPERGVAFRRAGEGLEVGAVLENVGESFIEQDFLVRVEGFLTDDPKETPRLLGSQPFFRDEGAVPLPPGARKGFVIPAPEETVRVRITIDEEDIVDEETHENNVTEVRVEGRLRR